MKHFRNIGLISQTRTLKKIPSRWLPALSLMAVIFIFSSIPSNELPNFDWADLIVKKGGHALGYGLLALSYAHGLRSNAQSISFLRRRRQVFIAWILASLYAVLDEFHQSFTPGRYPSGLDVAIDSCGSGLALLLAVRFQKPKDQPG